MPTLDPARWPLILDTSGVRRGAQRAERSVRRLGGVTGEVMGSMRLWVRRLGAGAFLALSVAIVRATKEAVNFQKQMAEVSTLVGDSTVDMGRMGIELRRLFTSLPVALDDLTKSLYQTVSASIDASEAIQFVDTAARAAIGGVTSTSVAVDGLTTVVNAWGMGASSATDVADTFFVAIRDGKTTFEELSKNIGTVAPSAAALGVTFDETASALAALTLQGLSTDKAAVAMRGFFMSIIKPTDDAQAMAHRLGLEWNSAALEAKGMVGFMKELREKTQGNNEALAALIPNSRALNGVQALLNEGFADLVRITEDTTNKTGLADEAYKKMMNTLDAVWKMFKNKLSDQFISMGQSWIPDITEALKGMSRQLRRLGSPLEETIATLRELGHPISPTLEFAIVKSGARAELAKLKKEFGALANIPITVELDKRTLADQIEDLYGLLGQGRNEEAIRKKLVDMFGTIGKRIPIVSLADVKSGAKGIWGDFKAAFLAESGAEKIQFNVSALFADLGSFSMEELIEETNHWSRELTSAQDAIVEAELNLGQLKEIGEDAVIPISSLGSALREALDLPDDPKAQVRIDREIEGLNTKIARGVVTTRMAEEIIILTQTALANLLAQEVAQAQINQSYDTYIGKLEEGGEAAEELSGEIAKVLDPDVLLKAVEAWEKYVKEVNKALEVLKKIHETVIEQAAPTKELSDAWKLLFESQDDLADLRAAEATLTEKKQRLTPELQGQIDSDEAAITKRIATLQKAIALLTKETGAGADEWEDYSKELQDILRGLGLIEKQMGRMELSIEAIRAAGQAFRDLGLPSEFSAIADASAAVLGGLKSYKAASGDSLEQLTAVLGMAGGIGAGVGAAISLGSSIFGAGGIFGGPSEAEIQAREEAQRKAIEEMNRLRTAIERTVDAFGEVVAAMNELSTPYSGSDPKKLKSAAVAGRQFLDETLKQKGIRARLEEKNISSSQLTPVLAGRMTLGEAIGEELAAQIQTELRGVSVEEMLAALGVPTAAQVIAAMTNAGFDTFAADVAELMASGLSESDAVRRLLEGTLPDMEKAVKNGIGRTGATFEGLQEQINLAREYLGESESELFSRLIAGLNEFEDIPAGIKGNLRDLRIDNQKGIREYIKTLESSRLAGTLGDLGLTPEQADKISEMLSAFLSDSGVDGISRSVQIARTITEIQAVELLAIQETALLVLQRILTAIQGGGAGAGKQYYISVTVPPNMDEVGKYVMESIENEIILKEAS